MTELPDDPTSDEAGEVTAFRPGAKRPARSAFRTSARKLTEKDLSSPVVLETLLEDIDRLQYEVDQLNIFKDKFHAKDKEAAVLGFEIESWRKGDVLYTISISIGSALLGGAPSFPKDTDLLLACAIVLCMGALIFRFWPNGRSGA